MNKNFNGKILPKELWGKGLDSSDKILLDEIISLSKQPSGCYAGDEHFAELLEETCRNVNRRIQKFKNQGRIYVTTIREGKKYKRYIKFISLIGSDKLIQTNPAIETDKLSSPKSKVETDKLTKGETDNLTMGDRQNVSGITQYKETPKMNDTNTGTVSTSRNGVEGRHDQNILDQNILGQKNSSKGNLQIVPNPPLRYGGVRDNEGDQNKTTSNEERVLEPKITCSNEVLGSGKRITSIEVPKNTFSNFGFEELEPEFNDEDLEIFRKEIDELFNEYKLPNWKTLLRNKPLHTFLSETSHIHSGIPGIIAMITIIHNNLK